MTSCESLSDRDLPGQPDGIDDYSHDLPDPVKAADRIDAYICAMGDGLYDVEDGQPLYGRDLNAVTRAVKTTAGVRVLAEIAEERRRQDAKWGEQNHPDGTGPDVVVAHLGGCTMAQLAIIMRARCQAAGKPGGEGDTWLNILLEEVFEGLAEADPAKLRTELIQVAAVAAQWVEAIDRRVTVQGAEHLASCHVAQHPNFRQTDTFPWCTCPQPWPRKVEASPSSTSSAVTDTAGSPT